MKIISQLYKEIAKKMRRKDSKRKDWTGKMGVSGQKMGVSRP
jgi:hypothetical protein